MSDDIGELKNKASQIRKIVLNMCIKAGTGHVTSSMSCVDILVALYHGGLLNHDPKKPEWSERDRFILSKGQASPVLYAVLADCGYFSTRDLNLFAQKDGKFGVHLQNSVPGVEITAGSLGQGFGTAAGIALGAKMNRELYLVCTLLGDGECYEGSIWETAMFASHNRLNNLVAIVDRNFLCVTDFTENLIALEPMADKWKSFGWDVICIDGHKMEEIIEAFKRVRSRRSAKPLVVIADTVKGEGIESFCYRPICHGIAPKGDEAKQAICELERRCSNE
ncbi:MAG: transketolase [Candidatus Omnitrophota bacterium]